jgi:hypothetical protein
MYQTTNQQDIQGDNYGLPRRIRGRSKVRP